MRAMETMLLEFRWGMNEEGERGRGIKGEKGELGDEVERLCVIWRRRKGRQVAV